MGLYPLFKFCSLLAIAFYAVGLGFRLVATYQTRDSFRAKGFLRLPTEKEWVSFLLRKRYELFDPSAATFFYAVSRVCLLGLIFSAAMAALLIFCTGLFYFLADVQQ